MTKPLSELLVELEKLWEKVADDPEWTLQILDRTYSYQEFAIRTYGVNREADARLIITLRNEFKTLAQELRRLVEENERLKHNQTRQGGGDGRGGTDIV